MRQSDGSVHKLSDLFEKYVGKFTAPEKVVIETFEEVVRDLLGVEIDKKQCLYTPSTRTLSINTKGPLKSELLLKKGEILNHLKGRLGEKSAPKEIL